MYRRAVVVAAVLANTSSSHAERYVDVFVGVSKPLGGEIHAEFTSAGGLGGARVGYRTSRFGGELTVDRVVYLPDGADVPSYKRSRVMPALLFPVGSSGDILLSLRVAAGLKLAEQRSYHFITREHFHYWHIGPVVESGLLLEIGRGWARFVTELAVHAAADRFGDDAPYRGTVDVDLRAGARLRF